MSFCTRITPCLRGKAPGNASCVKEMCEQKVDSRDSPQPAYQQFTQVGEGNGKYEVEMRYDFVGEGKGRFIKGTPARTAGKASMRQFLQADAALGKFFGGCLVALAIVAVLVLVGLGLMESSMGEFVESQKVPSMQRHDGMGKLPVPATFHSRGQAGELQGRAQAALGPALVVQPTATQEQPSRWAFPAATSTTTGTKGFDCGPTFIQQTDLSALLLNWGGDHRQWCCYHHGRGCSTTTTGSSTTITTTTRSSTTRTSTTVSSTTGTGTTTRTVTTTEPYNCEVDRSGWEASWSPYKKTYCCQHHHFGCPTTTAEAYDCTAGRESDWGFGRRYWCCWHHNRGCAADTARHFATTTTTPRLLGVPLPPAPAPAPTVPFDCLAGSGNWKLLWAPAKKGWCCANAGIGCEEEAQGT